MSDGVKVVGGTEEDRGVASALGDLEAAGRDPDPVPERRRRRRLQRPDVGRPRRWATAAVRVVAVLGVAGTVAFGLLWANLHGQLSGEAQARQSAHAFLVDLTNFDSKTVDADFGAVTSMATGKFATQAASFFNSSIRQELQTALASSRGQIRDIYVQSYGGGQAAVYAVVDQLYANDKVSSPQTDVLRMVVDMQQVNGAWKVADLTVLQGPTAQGATGTAGTTGVVPDGAAGTTAGSTTTSAPAG